MELVINEAGDDLTKVSLNGRMDSAGVDQVETMFTAATAARGKNAFVDMTEVTFLASMGIRMLIACAKALKLKGARMVLVGPQELVAGVIRDSSLDQLIPVAEGEEQARQFLTEG
jgi:anti-sigma B factor antagonist